MQHDRIYGPARMESSMDHLSRCGFLDRLIDFAKVDGGRIKGVTVRFSAVMILVVVRAVCCATGSLESQHMCVATRDIPELAWLSVHWVSRQMEHV